jgi:DNA-binding transcriptional ArsR family regulator
MSTCSDTQVKAAELLDTSSVTALTETFRVRGDATRVRILDALSRRELCVGDLATLIGASSGVPERSPR